LPDVKSGDFDHFALDADGSRLFLTGEENHSIEVFDLATNKRLESVKGIDTPHSMLYLPNPNELLVVDGDGTLKVLDGKNYSLTDKVKFEPDADSSAYDASKHLLYIASGGEEAKMDHCVIDIIDVDSRKRVGDIKVDSTNVEAIALEQNGPLLYANIRDKALVGVIDREKQTVVSTWPLPGIKGNTPIALDEPNHRLFVAARTPAKFLVLNTDSGQVVASLPTAPIADDMTFDAASKRIYVACDGFVVIYSQDDPDHYRELARIPTGFRAKTAILIPKLHRYYVAAPAHGQKPAELRVYEVS
jgi:DNA-binding beta-propeller fold protein YncE